MKRIKKILCYLDPTDHAKSTIEHAFVLANRHDAKICFIGVLKPIPSPISSLQQTYISLHEKLLAKQVNAYNGSKGNYEIRVILGQLGALEVVSVAVKEGFDLIIKPTDNKSHSRIAIFGSNDQQLLRKSSIPVWINKPSESFKCKKLLASVDINPDQPDNIELNKNIISLAQQMARTFDAELHVLHVWQLPYEMLLRESGSQDIIEKAEEARKTMTEQHEQWWRIFLEGHQLNAKNCQPHLLQGEVDEVIRDLSSQLGIDTVVMGTVARSGIEGFFIGNTAEKILSKLDSSVLAIKPESFKAPIK